MNVLSSLKVILCLLKCGRFLYFAKRIVSALTVVIILCFCFCCLFGDRKRIKMLSKKLGAVMK